MQALKRRSDAFKSLAESRELTIGQLRAQSERDAQEKQRIQAEIDHIRTTNNELVAETERLDDEIVELKYRYAFPA